MKTVIEINNLSKQYRLGQVGTGSIADDMKRWWYGVLGKEDPFLKLGEVNDRSTKGVSDYVWALRDVDFKVQQGEILGIIGKNGAGKSTLLKILSRTTAPTLGEYKIKGRVASLLEVGTGFHPDLTGRENVFLNGALLGMSKNEIARNFDEIVEFSGVERYIDTPVKRYSSGMYVRLAFAVAAHLESEILIVDEVLAVGDVEFQKKCIGKMGDVSSKQGRTVLFVSHSMSAIKSLCNRGIMMKQGSVIYDGNVQTAIDKYLFDGIDLSNSGKIEEVNRVHNTGEAKFTHAFVINDEGEQTDELYFKQGFKVRLVLEVYRSIENVGMWLCLLNSNRERLTFSSDGKDGYTHRNLEKGTYTIDVDYDLTLMPGRYGISVSLFYFSNGASIDITDSVFHFNVSKINKNKKGDYPWEMVLGYVEPSTEWKLQKTK